MRQLRKQLAIASVTFGLIAPVGAYATVLYDGTALPSAQGWTYFAPGATQTLNAGFVTLDTTANVALQGGYARNDQPLDGDAGFTLNFKVRVDHEAHSSVDRSGFSVIVTDAAARSIEIGFWQNEIWAQNADFSHSAESIAFSTGSLVSYALTVAGGHYTLVAGTGSNAQTFGGALRDYDPVKTLPIDPYKIPNFIFFGDDTTSAAAQISLQSVSLQAVPEPSSLLLAGFGLATLVAVRARSAKRLRRVASS